MKRRKFIGFVILFLCFLSYSCTVLAKDATMKNKKWITGKGGVIEEDEEGEVNLNSYGISYYKIEIPKQGYLVVDVKTSSLPGEDRYIAEMEQYDGEEYVCFTEIKFTDASKKVLGSSSNANGKRNFSFSAAVKKGTYYLAVEGEQKYKIRYSFTSVGKVGKAGKSPKKAVTLKRGVTVKNLLFETKSNEYDVGYGIGEKGHFYKISISEKKKVTFSFDCKIKPSLKFALLAKKGKDYRIVNEKGKLYAKDSFVFWEISGKDKVTYTLPKGTYYVQITGGSGYYTLKWK